MADDEDNNKSDEITDEPEIPIKEATQLPNHSHSATDKAVANILATQRVALGPVFDNMATSAVLGKSLGPLTGFLSEFSASIRESQKAAFGPGFEKLSSMAGLGLNAGMVSDLMKSFPATPDLGLGLSTTSFLSSLSSSMEWAKLAALSTNTLSASDYFEESDEHNYAYSEEMRSPASYFERDEVVIDSFESLNKAIAQLIKKNPDLPLVWRGQQNAEWGLQSSLYRKLQEQNGVIQPSGDPKGEQPFPTETQMQHAEARLIEYARDNWRLDEMHSLELLARLQHYGAPTRLLDVTRNPYVAAWFACEADPDQDEEDARLLVLATRPIPKKGEEERVSEADTRVKISDLPQTALPFWHYFVSPEERQLADWGTGAKRRVWVPSAYESRIAAQNGAFVLDGVPIVNSKTARSFLRGAAGEYWSKADLLASSSIYAKTYHPKRVAKSNGPNLAPTFTYRITAQAKAEIRDVLESRFGYNFSTMYPDISGAGRYLNEHFDDLTE
ncbi:FRG domain-containing protein [Cryobacterium lyxosi]|uniref:FRG domain-containing protein n=1 Tax=Cryobacterium lyxosi TaxID=1259228 RepID=A0A4R8ZH27_9MICO|nr:FRG domain-containing protein [Cryobacterium lyxosi]TFD27756.1 FRG domain-containing protein [Cryobacterium lyxosi]